MILLSTDSSFRVSDDKVTIRETGHADLVIDATASVFFDREAVMQNPTHKTQEEKSNADRYLQIANSTMSVLGIIVTALAALVTLKPVLASVFLEIAKLLGAR
jgi:hypothetical protein